MSTEGKEVLQQWKNHFPNSTLVNLRVTDTLLIVGNFCDKGEGCTPLLSGYFYSSTLSKGTWKNLLRVTMKSSLSQVCISHFIEESLLVTAVVTDVGMDTVTIHCSNKGMSPKTFSTRALKAL